MAARALSAFISAILLFATPEPNGRFVTGVVTDRNGNELNGAVVQLENEITLSVQSNITGLDVCFRQACVIKGAGLNS